MPFSLAARHAAIERQAGARQVKAIIGAKTDAGAVRKAGAPRRHRRAHRGKGGALPFVLRAVLVGGSKVAEQGLDHQAAQRPAAPVLDPQSKPVHAGVDHTVARPAFAALAPARDLLGRSAEHKSALQSLLRNTYAALCLNK